MEYLNLNGEIETLTFKEIKARTGKNISWAGMHELNKHKCDTIKGMNTHNFIKKYVGKVSVFDFNNMMEYGHLQLYPHFVKLALENNAIDKRAKW